MNCDYLVPFAVRVYGPSRTLRYPAVLLERSDYFIASKSLELLPDFLRKRRHSAYKPRDVERGGVMGRLLISFLHIQWPNTLEPH